MNNFINNINLPKRLLDRMNTEPFKEALNKEIPMSYKERNEIIERMGNQYGMEANVGKAHYPWQNLYFPTGKTRPDMILNQNGMDKTEFIINNPRFYSNIEENKMKHNILSTNHKDSLLHEYGHANDEQFGNVSKGINLLSVATPLGATIGAGQVATNALKNDKEDPEAQNSTLKSVLKGTGIGAGVGAAGFAGIGLLKEHNEDKANNFVKKYMADELGSAEKANEWFDNSSLPHARKMYRNGTLVKPLNALPMGLAGAAAGVGAYKLSDGVGAYKLRRNSEATEPQEKTASFTMVSLYK